MTQKDVDGVSDEPPDAEEHDQLPRFYLEAGDIIDRWCTPRSYSDGVFVFPPSGEEVVAAKGCRQHAYVRYTSHMLPAIFGGLDAVLEPLFASCLVQYRTCMDMGRQQDVVGLA